MYPSFVSSCHTNRTLLLNDVSVSDRIGQDTRMTSYDTCRIYIREVSN